MSYYTYDGDSLTLAEDPPNATYVSGGEGEDGTTRYYIFNAAGQHVGSTTQSPPPGTRRAPWSAIGEEGLLDVSRAHQAYSDGSWQKAAEYALGAQAENAISELTKVNPNYDWTASIKQAADQLNAAYGSDWQSPNRGSPGGVVAGILQTPAAQSDPAISGRVSQVLPYFKNKQHQDDVNILAEQSTHGSEGNMQMQFLTGVLGGALGGYFGGGEALSAPTYLGGDAMAASGIGAGGVTGAEMAGAAGAAAGAQNALTAAQQDALSKVTIDNNLASNVYGYGNAPVVDMSTMYNPASQTFAANSGNVTAGLTGSGALGNLVGGEAAVGAAAQGAATGGTAGAAGAAGAGAAGIGSALTIPQMLSGASSALGISKMLGGSDGGSSGGGSLLGSFMDSVSSNPMMKALQAGQGIAGIVSGLTSTQGMISPQDARAMADPFASSRQQYINQLNALMANPSLTTSTPGYQFNLQQGLAGIEAKQAKSGVSRTGAGDIGVQQYGQQQAMSSFDQQVKNLSGLSGAGVNPAQGATAALTAQGQQVDQRNAGWKAIGQGIGGVGQSLARGVGATQPGGYSMPNGWGVTDQNVNSNYTQGFDPASASMQPMGGYVADPTIGAQGNGFWDGYSGQTAPPQNYWGI